MSAISLERQQRTPWPHAVQCCAECCTILLVLLAYCGQDSRCRATQEIAASISAFGQNARREMSLSIPRDYTQVQLISRRDETR